MLPGVLPNFSIFSLRILAGLKIRRTILGPPNGRHTLFHHGDSIQRISIPRLDQVPIISHIDEQRLGSSSIRAAGQLPRANSALVYTARTTRDNNTPPMPWAPRIRRRDLSLCHPTSRPVGSLSQLIAW